ncbi:hypothetical protein AVI51_06970 [Piscirickettsia salmonis]|uniref:Uncharacterized protein n=1 Tax=Piscirickettsia salmonis TaxID=1238 RepID=A0A9Q5YI26_PISSA|nr:DUF493 family protein [Piscirickettsia salmonis]ALA25814.1 hypothetical protein KW89_2352 [Piscirickettsia salmonis]APS43293.1 hypothetical protein AVI48_02165 [Piscirickettsia salmonis]APS46643.1 hypothetical protein AVI49_02770 [Piscirickettsia salmonis]APS53823.1 hypothetical protein AVI51_06970 [Piscirickettsia salmonis]APS56889.1 hypothetical protein AVI52_06300 [Piscirickettsia salmonis]
MKTDNFKELLEENYTWPAEYPFKFIVPKDQIDLVLALFPEQMVKQTPSKKGNYISISCKKRVQSSEAVLALYEQAAQIQGLISL